MHSSPMQSILKSNPFLTALLTSWSGKLSNPTWPVKSRWREVPPCERKRKRGEREDMNFKLLIPVFLFLATIYLPKHDGRQCKWTFCFNYRTLFFFLEDLDSQVLPHHWNPSYETVTWSSGINKSIRTCTNCYTLRVEVVKN